MDIKEARELKEARKALVHECRNAISNIKGQTTKIKKRQEGNPCFRWCKYWRSVIDDELLRIENALEDFNDWAKEEEKQDET